ncbi:hypothetical protein, partial [Microbulbifer hydrolyticus]|uniref:hypothetical protein n=1 Tax=Microbulbifer hydrolyticus TaxID=48074 RepID=UPI001C846756
TAYLVHVLRGSLRSHFCAKRAQGKLPLLAALGFNQSYEKIYSVYFCSGYFIFSKCFPPATLRVGNYEYS